MAVASVTISPSVLRWARESGGYSIEYVSAKTKLSKLEIEKWEKAKSDIPFSTVEKLANVFKRPTIVLLRDTPPIEPINPPYFRKRGSHTEISSDIRFTIRKARNLQRISKELIGNLDFKPVHKFDQFILKRLPEEIAEAERRELGISYAEQTTWKDYPEALKNLKSHVEKKGIFVFQIGMPTDQVQGLSLIDDIAPAILLNSKDVPQRRIFTLLHEYAHILIGRPGICADIDSPVENGQGLEMWCNGFAGAFLVPKKELSEFVQKRLSGNNVRYGDIQVIAKHFHVSNHMIFIRMKINGLIPDSDYSALDKIFGKSPEIIPKKTAAKKTGKRKGGVPQYKKVISERGTQFVNLVLKNEGKKKISTAEALDYLSVKLESLEKMKSAVEG